MELTTEKFSPNNGENLGDDIYGSSGRLLRNSGWLYGVVI